MGAWSVRWLALGAALAVAGACSGKSKSSGHGGKNESGRGGDESTGGSSTSGSGGEGAGGAGEGGADPEACEGESITIPTRIVRLSFSQIENAVAELVGEQPARAIATEVALPPLADRYFPPLVLDPAFTDTEFYVEDRIGQAVGRYVLENFEEATDCGATPTDACGEEFVLSFAEKAARRPLTDEERENFVTVYTECKSFGGTVQEAVQHGVYAAIDSPLFTYRFELGEPEPSEPSVLLAPYEMASLLSFFVTDGPPDAELLATAADGSIAELEVVQEQTLRLLETPAARENLDAAMLSYFGFQGIQSVVIDDPVVTTSLKETMAGEAERFVDGVLFGDAPLPDLLLARSSFANRELAAIYGIDGFPNGEPLDADGFAAISLPDSRAGLLTMPGRLMAHSRPEATRPSIIERGRLVKA